MKDIGEYLVELSVELIILVSTVVVIAFMVTGGCGNENGSPTPTASPPTTGFPPECNGTFDVSLSCPAESLAGSVCLPYYCDILDSSGAELEVFDTFSIVFGRNCTETDCFTLECSDLSIDFEDVIANEATFIIESIDDIPVGEDVEGVQTSGRPKGSIIIDGEEFEFTCPGYALP